VGTAATALEGLGFPEVPGKVVVFVPEDDEERDAVWLRTVSDETWHFSFQVTRTPQPVSARGPHYRDYWLP
jgi:hypothetical protein